jgi:hypothetical protein
MATFIPYSTASSDRKSCPYSVLDFDSEEALSQALKESLNMKLEHSNNTTNGQITVQDWKVPLRCCDLDVDTEVQRLQSLKSFAVLETEQEETFDELTECVRETLQASWACISFVDLGRQWFKAFAEAKDAPLRLSSLGVVDQSARKDALCAYTILQREMLVVPDTRLDDRFRDSALVTSPPHLRFYAGVPLVTPEGSKIGSLCVLDREPRPEGLLESQREFLLAKADEVMKLLLERRNQLQTMKKRPSETNLQQLAAKSSENNSDSTSSSSYGEQTDQPDDQSLEGWTWKRTRPDQGEDVLEQTIVIDDEQQQPTLPSPDNTIDPDDYLIQLLEAMYPNVKLGVKSALELDGHFPSITEEQMGAYAMEVVNLARSNNVKGLRQYHAAHGRAALDCYNRFGEGLLNMACRRGFVEMAEFLMSPPVNLEVRIRDDYGRTPMHDACWNPEPQLEICAWIMKKDPSLFLVADKRGFTPFQYARKSDWGVWNQFLFDQCQHLRALANPEVIKRFHR